MSDSEYAAIERWADDHFSQGEVAVVMRLVEEFGWRPPGRPLGEASGGDPGFWDRLGLGLAGMPRHLPMGVLFGGQGPVGDDIAHHYVCWCGDIECPLTLALGHAWAAGKR